MDNKGRSGVGGFFLGFLLGLIGLIIAAVWPAATIAPQRSAQMAHPRKAQEEVPENYHPKMKKINKLA